MHSLVLLGGSTITHCVLGPNMICNTEGTYHLFNDSVIQERGYKGTGAHGETVSGARKSTYN